MVTSNNRAVSRVTVDGMHNISLVVNGDGNNIVVNINSGDNHVGTQSSIVKSNNNGDNKAGDTGTDRADKQSRKRDRSASCDARSEASTVAWTTSSSSSCVRPVLRRMTRHIYKEDER